MLTKYAITFQSERKYEWLLDKVLKVRLRSQT